MTGTERAVKCFALILAASIVLSIISGAVAAIMWFTRLVGIESSEGAPETSYFSGPRNNEVFESLGSIKIDTGDVFVMICEGATNGISTYNLPSNYKIDYSGGNLKVVDDGDGDFFDKLFGGDFMSFEQAAIEITVKKGTVLDNVNLNLGSGRTEINSISTLKLDIDSGSGPVSISDVKAEELEGNFGSGNVSMERMSITDATIDSGSGRFYYNGSLAGFLDVDGGSGSLSFEINGQPELYSLRFDAGSGGIWMNGNKADSLTTLGSGKEKIIKLDGGSGRITIDFK